MTFGIPFKQKKKLLPSLLHSDLPSPSLNPITQPKLLHQIGSWRPAIPHRLLTVAHAQDGDVFSHLDAHDGDVFSQMW